METSRVVTRHPTFIEILAAQGIDVAAEFGEPTGARLRHLCQQGLGPLYIPYCLAGTVDAIDPASSPQVTLLVDDRAGIGPHPCNPVQLPVVAVTRCAQEEDLPRVEFVSIAHIAHRDCQQCEYVWLQRAAEYAVALRAIERTVPSASDAWALFMPLPSDDGAVHVLVHSADLPPSDD